MTFQPSAQTVFCTLVGSLFFLTNPPTLYYEDAEVLLTGYVKEYGVMKIAMSMDTFHTIDPDSPVSSDPEQDWSNYLASIEPGDFLNAIFMGAGGEFQMNSSVHRPGASGRPSLYYWCSSVTPL